ncbi:hypothetical protein BCR41DRAFT_367701 [Lobosporangium transversale]|uniref:Uncharacterized protein n=1 Tax=Lobosporangium transversale TaxID=64571 RepID=A0A1Y2GYG5_9FUNG|nr:hypothetical protein BCR41DRAFT_367701 [Lobosporangium transversale]ORZ27350.1 hypothetical protein BCR41DRAFT_367701 [Lobosporangium transversale]|eukprot:XP_021885077.1 hypothetical protein BCR41DRAFT_367701 [Lobosporangium transversale]
MPPKRLIIRFCIRKKDGCEESYKECQTLRLSADEQTAQDAPRGGGLTNAPRWPRNSLTVRRPIINEYKQPHLLKRWSNIFAWFAPVVDQNYWLMQRRGETHQTHVKCLSEEQAWRGKRETVMELDNGTLAVNSARLLAKKKRKNDGNNIKEGFKSPNCRSSNKGYQRPVYFFYLLLIFYWSLLSVQQARYLVYRALESDHCYFSLSPRSPRLSAPIKMKDCKPHKLLASYRAKPENALNKPEA